MAAKEVIVKKWLVLIFLPFFLVNAQAQTCPRLEAKAKTELVLHKEVVEEKLFSCHLKQVEEVGAISEGEYFVITNYFFQDRSCHHPGSLWLLVQSRDNVNNRGWIFIEKVSTFQFWHPGLWDWTCED